MATTHVERQCLPDWNSKLPAKTDLGSPPRLLIIGAGARGNAFARAVTESTEGSIVAVAEPARYKRESLGKKYIWGFNASSEDQSFDDWRQYVQYENDRRQKEEEGLAVAPGVDGVFVCTLDETHAEIIIALSSLALHIMSEKPLATTLNDCLRIYRALQPVQGEPPQRIFSIGHVLHYSPHNILLRKLLLEDEVVGEVISIEHTEPVGWWHFAHSYVRGNWRKESTAAPSLLTKSCHDIDLMLWLLCSPAPGTNKPPHLPSHVTSTGSLTHFKRLRKPALAGDTTNCLTCPAERECIYSAKKIYEEDNLAQGNIQWPVDIVYPEIEDCIQTQGYPAAAQQLRARLAENYNESTPQEAIDRRPWFGRCVYESANDVCDDQTVTIAWDDDPLPSSPSSDPATPAAAAAAATAELLKGRGAKTALIHMTAFTDKICERRGHIYGSAGELHYDSHTISVHDFATKSTRVHHPPPASGGHGGGDAGLTGQFVKAVNAVKNLGEGVEEAQTRYVGCTLEDVMRSHAMVWAAEEARRERKVVGWREWWKGNVEDYGGAA